MQNHDRLDDIRPGDIVRLTEDRDALVMFVHPFGVTTLTIDLEWLFLASEDMIAV